MPLFKKILWTLILIFIFLLGMYYVFFNYVKNVLLYDFDYLKDISSILDISFKNFKEIFKFTYFSCLDSIVLFISFRWNRITFEISTYMTFVLIVGAPSILFFFKLLTYRGFKAIKLTYKRAIANPFYYQDWRDSIKYSTYDNFDEPMPIGIQFILITIRIIIMFFIIFVLPAFMLFYILLEICGIIKGITNTGKINDFD